MVLIPLSEYAKKHKKAFRSARQMAQTGGFETAHKIGRNWLIDSEEEYPDRRTKKYKKNRQK